MGSDAGEDLLEMEGFGEVIHAAAAEGPGFVDGFGEGADEEDGDVGQGGIGFEAGANLVAVDLRHGDVEQDDVGRVGVGGVEGEPAGGEGAHLVSGAEQDFLKDFEVGRGVVDEHDRFRGGSGFAVVGWVVWHRDGVARGGLGGVHFGAGWASSRESSLKS